MGRQIILSVEVLLIIIENIWDEPEEIDFYSNFSLELRTLAAMSLTCRDLHVISQRHLVRRIILHNSSHLLSLVEHLERFPEYKPFVQEIVIISSYLPLSDIVNRFVHRLSGKVPNLRTLRLRTEMPHREEVPRGENVTVRPSIALHKVALTALRRFTSLSALKLFGVRFGSERQMFNLLFAMKDTVRVFQCEELEFDRLPSDETSYLLSDSQSQGLNAASVLASHQLMLTSIDVRILFLLRRWLCLTDPVI